MWQRFKNLAIDTAISTPLGLLVGLLLAWFGTMPWWLIFLCSLLPAIAIWGILLRRKGELQDQIASKGRFFLDEIATIPKDNCNEFAWDRWMEGINALLRGRGQLRKSQVLRSLIAEAGDDHDRRMVAESFLRGLAEEANQGQAIVGE